MKLDKKLHTNSLQVMDEHSYEIHMNKLHDVDICNKNKKNNIINEYKIENIIQFLEIIYLCSPWFQLQQTN